MPRGDSGALRGIGTGELTAAAIEALPASMCLLDAEGTIATVNAAWRGFAASVNSEPADVHTTGVGVDYLGACDRAALAGDVHARDFAAGLRAVLADERDWFAAEYPCETPGGMRWFVGRVSAFITRGQRWALVLHDDVTGLKLSEAALERRAAQRAEDLRLSEQRYEIVARASHEGLFDWSAGLPAYFSDRFLEILGYAEPGRGGFWWLAGLHPDDVERTCAVLSHPFAAGGPIAADCRLRRADGTYAWCVIRGFAVFDAGRGRVRRVVGTLSDVTHQKRSDAALLAGAGRDGLTGLPSRVVFMDRIGQALAHHRRDGRGAFSLLLIDLDRFGALNRHYGSDVGDSILLEAARRIVAAAPENAVARLGGDEFSVLLDHAGAAGDGTAAADALAARIGHGLAVPFPVAGAAHKLTASIGVVHVTRASGHDDAAAVMADADLAMLTARQRGGSRWEVFEPGQRTRARRSYELGDALRETVESGDEPMGLSLAYQPVVDLATGRIAGFEALMRWTHPRLGSVPPVDFIPVAEAGGLIIPMGAWAIRRGCAQLARWQRLLPRDRRPFVSVNLSARQLYEPGFEEIVRTALAGSGALAGGLKLEVTESAILDNALRAASVLSALQDLGVRVAIDDFGTGFSCLGYLSRFRFNELKIDASFVRAMTGNDRALAVVRTIVELGRGLDMSVIAEGAEHQHEVRTLGRIGCRMIQGYFFGHPLPAADAERLLTAGVAENWFPGLAA